MSGGALSRHERLASPICALYRHRPATVLCAQFFNGNRAVAVNPNGSVNTPDTPCSPNDIELLYLSGLGRPDQDVATGAGAPSAEPLVPEAAEEKPSFLSRLKPKREEAAQEFRAALEADGAAAPGATQR